MMPWFDIKDSDGIVVKQVFATVAADLAMNIPATLEVMPANNAGESAAELIILMNEEMSNGPD